MSALSLRLPNSLHRHIKDIAQQEGVSINQFISSAVSEKISAIMTEEYLEQRARKANKAVKEGINSLGVYLSSIYMDRKTFWWFLLPGHHRK